MSALKSGDEGLRRSQVKRALVASTVGTSIEWYDFFLYGTAAALVFPHLFFPGASNYAGVLASFATYAVGFAARPVGAALFGHWGDRVGRKATLISTLLVMGLASFAIGVMPTYDTIGVWAPTLLVLLRILQGIGVGGEWGGSITLSMEWGDQRRRGLIASWPQVGVPIGLLLSTGAVSLFTHLTGDGFDSWGWRIPFLLSILLVGLGLWIRLGVLDSPMFQREVENATVERQPVLEVIKRNPKEILLSAMLRMSEQMPFYIFTVFVLEYGKDELGFGKTFLTNSVAGAAALALFFVPFFGHLSDRIGRKRMYMIGAACTFAWAIPYFLLLDHGTAALVSLTIVVSLIPHNMQYGPQAALIAETFPTRLRYSGAGIGYQLASVVAGGPAPLVAAWLLHTFNSSLPIALYIMAGAVVTLIATALLPQPVPELERAPTGRFARPAEDREPIATESSSRA
ncbi:MFS transporter [Candidatus Solirubrobacter pratensis]|uniref:MFS transporter n=1 Tax=Candidatus Solirubrobacter pratensis TaxID=1298857 RepID=UPI0004231ABC|nr:MFS transporter [Candidatus Solirubrobacter pratensis]